jgi:hypothetical protein
LALHHGRLGDPPPVRGGIALERPEGTRGTVRLDEPQHDQLNVISGAAASSRIEDL